LRWSIPRGTASNIRKCIRTRPWIVSPIDGITAWLEVWISIGHSRPEDWLVVCRTFFELVNCISAVMRCSLLSLRPLHLPIL
jgi:hypothetical protein